MMERARKSLKGRSWRKVITYFLTCCMFLNTSLPAVLASPTGGVFTFPVTDPGTIVQGVTDSIVTVNQAQSIIQWGAPGSGGIDTSSTESLTFLQAEGLSNSAVLNRIMSGNRTQFDGTLNGLDMRIFIVNPAGIMFGGGSTVNVTQLVASGLGMTNKVFNDLIADPVNNKMEFLEGDGKVTSRATINANSVYLIGKKVSNIGPIIAPDGLVVMAAGDEVRLYENGSNVSVVVSTLGDGLDNPDVRNSNIIKVDNGKIILAAGDTLSRAISNFSNIAASGGEVEMQASLVENRGKIRTNASTSDGNGGSISLIGTDEVIIGPDKNGYTSEITANAGLTGDGGTITIKAGTEDVEGKVTIEKSTLITASGGSVSGNGGSVTITCDDFEIAGDIYASPGNKINEPGKLEINTPNVIIADGQNPTDLDPLAEVAENTLYENDIEALSWAGTSLIVNAEEGITVKDIDDNEITGKFGSIELHATGENSAVTFADDVTDTIRTSLGDIIIEAGSGGITVGNLITGKDLADLKPAPGQIFLTTENGGDIETGDLIIESGWRHAEINVKASGNLTVNGDVRVGMNEDGVKSSILNVPPDASAEAMIYLKAADNVVLEGDV
ncbi:MAG TPA: filamentous hemagglutinin N-terminal domain-containing protein, partial [Sedimentisphaerales bacterium]|nr:filamentous hemagglutinin N-terminal domain-containing protein [Sedimentisphaerales bacterium]